MSLLFLSNVLDEFQALDDNGDPLPFAVLTFWQSATVEPRAVYADQDLNTVLSNAEGRVVADALGRFPLIYLAVTGLYRIRLDDGEGRLRWDVDPYICDCKDPPYVFRCPVNQQLTPAATLPPSTAAPSLGGSTIEFTDADAADAPTRVYADAARKIGLRNPLPSNAAGVFPPVYLDDDVSYHVRVYDPDGNLALDLDPYECECGFELLTSRIYPLEDLASFGEITTLPFTFMGTAFFEDIGPFGESLAMPFGIMSVVAGYQAFDAGFDAFDEGFDIVGGTFFLAAGFDSYSYGPENFDGEVDITGGTLAVVAGYIAYTIPPENFDGRVSITGGSLA